MAKRSRDEAAGEDIVRRRGVKRIKPSAIDHLCRLSDELLLRVLSFLSIPQLTTCQRLSHKYFKLAGDGQLWKSHYYDRFVRPRASRLPGLKELGALDESLNFASRASRWLDDEYLVKRGQRTNWKQQYKLRHNWTRGSCAVNEIPVAEECAVPPILVEMHNGIIISADQADGIRAWSAKGSRELVAQIPCTSATPPTSLAIDGHSREHDTQSIIVGFEDGSFRLYVLNRKQRSFAQQYCHWPSSDGIISSIALSWPYVLTMTATQLLSIYQFDVRPPKNALDEIHAPPKLLHSLKSQSVWPPLSTNLRITEDSIFICVAYTLPTYLSGWTVGIQEVQICPQGTLRCSRLASAIDQHYRPLAFTNQPVLHHLAPFNPDTGASSALELRHIHSKPTSLSYTHPYLLVSHPDNTLTLYLVTSTPHVLSISAGSRLFGHTSSVSGAQVCRRGKAVSVSKRGDELRIWELEGGFGSAAARKRLASGDIGVAIRVEKSKVPSPRVQQSGLDLKRKGASVALLQSSRNSEDDTLHGPSELTLTRGWIGFDEENVVVLKEHSQGRQSLVVYDFA